MKLLVPMPPVSPDESAKMKNMSFQPHNFRKIFVEYSDRIARKKSVEQRPRTLGLDLSGA